MVVAKAKAVYEKLAKERQRASGGKHKAVMANLPQPDKGAARDKMGKARGIEYEKKRAKERQKQHGGTAPGKNTGGKPATSDSGKSRDKMGKALGVSGRSKGR